MIRIVKMSFIPERIPAFRELFKTVKHKIEGVEGCQKVDLVQSSDDESTLMTISHWTGPEALEAYRQSDLFKSTWAKTKIHFNDKPEAWSVNIIE